VVERFSALGVTPGVRKCFVWQADRAPDEFDALSDDELERAIREAANLAATFLLDRANRSAELAVLCSSACQIWRGETIQNTEWH